MAFSTVMESLESEASARTPQRKPVAVPVRFVKSLQSDLVDSQLDMESSEEPSQSMIEEDAVLEDLFQEVAAGNHRALACELRKEVEADFKDRTGRKGRQHRSHATSSNTVDPKRAACDSPDQKHSAGKNTSASTYTSGIPAALTRFIRSEVHHAIREESDAMFRNMEDRFNRAVSSALSQRSHHLFEVLSNQCRHFAHDKVSHDVDLETDFAMTIATSCGAELRGEAEKARQELDASITEKLHDVFEQCADIAEECWGVAAWHEVDTSHPSIPEEQDENNGAMNCMRTKHNFAVDNLPTTSMRLGQVLRHTAATVELESRARQESELWLLGRLHDTRDELHAVLLRMLNLLAAQGRPEYLKPQDGTDIS